MYEQINLTLWAIITVLVFSVLWKMNLAYSFVISAYVGGSAGFGLAYALQKLISYGEETLAGNYFNIFGLLLGFMAFGVFFKKYSYLPRITSALLVGVGVGTSMRLLVVSDVTKQIVPLSFSTGDMIGNISSIVGVVVTCLALLYFIFTMGFEKGKISSQFRTVRRIGLLFLMVSVGYIFQGQVVSRTTTLIGRITFLFKEWLGAIMPG